MAQGLWKDETHNWDEDELLELVVAQFGDREAEPSVHRLLPIALSRVAFAVTAVIGAYHARTSLVIVSQ